MTIRTHTLALLACLAGMPMAAADALRMPAADEARDDLRGMTMERVRSLLGEPRRILPPVGDPPITRWVYDGMTVYFENDRVIHAVRHSGRSPARP